MRNFFRSMLTNLGVAGEVFTYLWRSKRWWITPMVAVLLLFGFMLICSTASGLAPFVYTLF